jgi:hypothetical protein
VKSGTGAREVTILDFGAGLGRIPVEVTLS